MRVLLFIWSVLFHAIVTYSSLLDIKDQTSFQQMERDALPSNSKRYYPNEFSEQHQRVKDSLSNPISNVKIPSTPNERNVVLMELDKAFGWTFNNRDRHWGWGQDTPYTVLSLLLANRSWFETLNLEAELIKKQFEMQLILRLWRQKDTPIAKGQLALSVLGLVALCRDPRSFHGKDLINLLDHQENKVNFEFAFASLATCVAGKHARKYEIRKLTKLIKYSKKLNSVDTLAIVILALRCIELQKHHQLTHYINEAVEILMNQQAKDGSFNGNLHSTAIAIQAMMVSGLSDSWNGTKAQQYVMSRALPDGSFGSIFDTNAVLPLLAGKTLLDAHKLYCLHYTDTNAADSPAAGVDETDDRNYFPSKLQIKNYINVTCILWLGTNVTYSNHTRLTVPPNTPFFTFMNLLAEKDAKFEFSLSEGPNGYYIESLFGKKSNFSYWFLYKLKKQPIVSVKPSNDLLISQDLQNFVAQDGDFLLFWYRQI